MGKIMNRYLYPTYQRPIFKSMASRDLKSGQRLLLGHDFVILMFRTMASHGISGNWGWQFQSISHPGQTGWLSDTSIDADNKYVVISEG